MSISIFVNEIFYFYSLLILIRIFLTWIPSIDWNRQPFKAMREATDAYLNIFKSIIPPYGGIDFSPIIALLVLQLLQVFFVTIVRTILG